MDICSKYRYLGIKNIFLHYLLYENFNHITIENMNQLFNGVTCNMIALTRVTDLIEDYTNVAQTSVGRMVFLPNGFKLFLP